MSFQTYEDLTNAIEWDNWTREDEEHEEGKDGDPTGDYWDVTEVLYCRLDWVKGQLDAKDTDDANHIETIEMAQAILTRINDAQLKKIMETPEQTIKRLNDEK